MMLLGPTTPTPGGYHLSTPAIVIIVVLVVIGIVGILGWRAPDRSPGVEEKAERDRIED